MSASSARRDFSARTIRALRANGIALIGTTSVPGEGPMPMANATRGYVLDDNGTQRIRSHSQVLALASEPCEMAAAIEAAFNA